MKTKTIKKINLALLAVLLCLTAGAGVFAIFAGAKVSSFGPGLFAGKADVLAGLERSEQAGDAQAEVEVSGGEQAVQLSGQETQGAQTLAVSEQKSQNQEQNLAKFSFAVMGDTDSKSEKNGFSSKLDLALGKSKEFFPDFVLFTGDVLRAGEQGGISSKTKLENLKALIEKHYNNYYFAFGNQDIACGEECIGLWQQIFFSKEKQTEKAEKQKLYHSFDFQNTHFVLLSTDHPKRYGVDEEQLQWLENDLANNKQKNTIVAQNVPPVVFFENSSRKCHDMTCDQQARQKLLAIYKKYKVDLVLCGNENAFDHQIVEGTDFVLSGSIGNQAEHKQAIKGDIYVLCSIQGERISLQAMDTKGQVIRKIEIK